MASTIWRGYTLQERSQSSGASPDEAIESDRSSATRIYDIDWSPNVIAPVAQRQQIIKQIIGYSEVKKTPDGISYVSRVTPHFSYNWKRTTDAEPFLYATKVRTQGLGPCPNAATYQNLGGKRDGTHMDPIYAKNRLTVTYESLPFEIRDDSEMAIIAGTGGAPDEATWTRYIQKIVKPSAEFFTIPAGSTRQVGGGNSIIEIGVGKMITFYNLQVTWFQVPEAAVPCKAINSGFTEANCIEGIIGSVNNATFNGYTQGQLLLLAAELRPYRSPFGARIYDITYMMKFFAPGHHKIYRPLASPPAYYEITTTRDSAGTLIAAGTSNVENVAPATGVLVPALQDGVSIYNWRNFNLLFRHGT